MWSRSPTVAHAGHHTGGRSVEAHPLTAQQSRRNTRFRSNVYDKWIVFLQQKDGRKVYGVPETALSENGVEQSNNGAGHGLPSESGVEHLRDLVKSGVPEELRGEVWFSLSGARALRTANQGLYTSLQKRSLKNGELDNSILLEIEKDIHRTGLAQLASTLKSKHYSCVASEAEASEKLRNVLASFALHRPEVGYCQSTNFVVALLLVFMEEEDAFFTLDILATSVLRGYYTQDIEGLQVDLLAFADMVEECLPQIHEHISKLDAAVFALCLPWFVCAFAQTLPHDAAMRVWDLLFLEGHQVLFRVGLGLLRIHHDFVLGAADCESLVTGLTMRAAEVEDVDALLDSAERYRDFVATSLERLQNKHRDAVAARSAEIAERRRVRAIQRATEDALRQEAEAGIFDGVSETFDAFVSNISETFSRAFDAIADDDNSDRNADGGSAAATATHANSPAEDPNKASFLSIHFGEWK